MLYVLLGVWVLGGLYFWTLVYVGARSDVDWDSMDMKAFRTRYPKHVGLG